MKRQNKILYSFIIFIISISLFSSMVYGFGGEPSNWAVKEVNEALKINIVPSSFLWDYKSDTTRREFCEIAIRIISYIYGADIESILELENIKLKTPFNDTDDSDILRAYSLGIVNGVGNGKFDPYSKITREQAAALINNIINFFEYSPEDISISYKDTNNISNYALEGVKKATATGVMTGSGGNFNPKGSYTHEQSIISIYRLTILLKDEYNKKLFSEDELEKIKEIKEINKKLNRLGNFSGEKYLISPDINSPYSIGKLNPEFLKEALDYVNFVRYLAGLPEVELSDNLNNTAQHGAFILAASNQFTHYPKNTTNLPSDIFSIGAESCKSSNIGYGHSSLYYFNRSCMDDSDLSNIDRVGHRRWLLSPRLGKIGMGYVNNISNTYVFDSSINFTDWDTINWPSAGVFPRSEFRKNMAWSVSLGDNYIPNGLTEVQITRKSDGETWMLSKSSKKTGLEYFNVDTGGYGYNGPCIIFRPDVKEYISGEEYYITITGLKSVSNNKDSIIKYSVKFF